MKVLEGGVTLLRHVRQAQVVGGTTCQRVQRPRLVLCTSCLRQLSTASQGSLNAFYPKLNVKKAKQSDPLYLLDHDVAGKLASRVLESCAAPPDMVFDCNAGAGVVSRQLLQQGVRSVVAVEPELQFSEHLAEVKDDWPEHFHVMNHMSLLVPSAGERDTELATLLSDASDRLGREPETVVLGTLALDEELRLSKLLQAILRTHSPLVTSGHVLFAPLITAQGYAYFNRFYAAEAGVDLQSYRASSVILQNLFQASLLDQYPREAFYPRKSPKKKMKVLGEMDEEEVYMLGVRIRDDALTILDGGDSVPAFCLFITQMMQKRKARFIPTFEKLVPHCGLRLIDMGFTMMQRTGDIPPRRYLAAFHELLKWPEYHDSPLLCMVRDLATSSDVIVDGSDKTLAHEVEERVNG